MVISLIVDTVLSGDVVLSALPEGGVIERKTPRDMAQLYWGKEGTLRKGTKARALCGLHDRCN